MNRRMLQRGPGGTVGTGAAREAGLSDKEFEIFRALVHEHTGISLSESKRTLLQARLTRRLRALGLATFSEYHRVLTERDSSGEEPGRASASAGRGATQVLTQI